VAQRKRTKIPLYETHQRILEVQWIDAQSEDEWQLLDKIDTTPMYIKTIGYFIEKTDVDLIICRSLSSDKGLEGRFHIPLKCIKKTKKIR